MDIVIIVNDAKISSTINSITKETVLCKSIKSENIIFFLEYNKADIVFIDVENEKTNWQLLCEQVFYIDSRIKIVLLCNGNEYALEAFEIGVFDYIIKPIDQKQLERVLKKWKDTSNIE